MKHGIRISIAALMLVLVSNPPTSAQRRSLSRFAVDFVTLKSGERLRGAFMGRNAQRIVSMAVQREWLKKNEPKLFAQLTRTEVGSATQAQQQLIERIQKWMVEVKDEPLLTAYLKRELRNAQSDLADLKDDGVNTQFLVVRFPDADIRFKFSQQAANRQVALLAWEQNYENVETREVRDLSDELKKDGLADLQVQVNLSDRLPVKAQTEEQWAARQALVEFSYGERFEYQGMGKALFRTEEGKQQDLAAVLPQLLPSLLQNQLGQLGDLQGLLNEPGLDFAGLTGLANKKKVKQSVDFSKPIADAERAGARSFRVTTLDMNRTGGQASVTGYFVAQMPDGKWKTIWRSTLTESANKARPDIENQIKNDPQLKQVTQLLDGLGGKIGGLGLNGQLDSAIRFGAATMDAQRKVNDAFFKFRDQYTNQLGGPAIDIPAVRPDRPGSKG